MKKFKILALTLAFVIVVGAFSGCTTDERISETIDDSRPVLTIGFAEDEGVVKVNDEEVEPGEEIILKKGDTIELEAVPGEDYIFERWEGVENGEEEELLEDFEITEKVEIVARFQETGTVSGYVTDSRGGPGVEGAKIKGLNAETTTDEEGYFTMDVKADELFDILVEKENRGMVRVQDVMVEHGEQVEYELPSRETFNPDWPATSPRIEVNGVESGDVVSGELEIEFSVDGDRPTYVYYVNFGGLQRGPREAFDIDADEGEAVIDTSKHPNGDSFIRILAYDDNENTVVKFIPVIVDNEIGEGEPPEDLFYLGLTSISLGENFGYFSDRREQLEAEMNKDIDPEIYETPEGQEIDLSQIPDDSTLSIEIMWAPVDGADGYSVYRSFDGEEFEHIGNITQYTDVSDEEEDPTFMGIYNDFSSKLSIRETHYKVVPYNEYGEAESLTREITPLAPYNVELLTPEHEATEVDLMPEFTWELDIKGEWEEEVTILHGISLFEATDWLVLEDVIEDENEYALEFELDPNTVYSWDIFYSEAFSYEEDEAGFSDAVTIAGAMEGSQIGEFMFTTQEEDAGDATPDEIADLLNYDHLYRDADSDSVLVKSSDLDNLDSLVGELGSSMQNKWEAIDWAKISLPAGRDIPEFLDELRQKEKIMLAQPNLEQEIPYHEKMSESQIESMEDRLLADPDLGAEDFEKQLWGMKNIKAEEAWEITTGSDDVAVAIVDTGVDMDHPEFVNNEFVAPFNATGDEGPGAYDIQGHGTHVAGTAVADGRTGKIAGVSWDNPIMPIRVMDLDGVIYSDYTIEGIFHIVDYMQENDVRVVANYSIGGRGYDAAMKDALDYAMDEGLIWVTSAGNDGKRVPNLPASYNGLISVAASNPWDEQADFSTSGFWNSIAAPGVHIWSTYPTFADPDIYMHMEGTSMAAPHVAGAAALLLSENPDLSAVEVLNQVEQTAQGSGFTEELGYGILDVKSLLGDIEPVNYGSLQVNTDREGAKMTIFDDAGNLVGFAAVGSDLTRQIHALAEGNYTVKSTFIDYEEGESTTLTEEVSISAEAVTEIDMMFD